MTTDAAPTVRPARLLWLPRVVAAWCLLTIAAAVALRGERSYLADALTKANAKAAKPKADYTGAVVDKDVTNILRFDLVQSVLVSVILLMLTFAVLRGRGWARWTLLGMATVLPVIVNLLGVGVLIQLVIGIVSSFPALYKTLEVLAGLASLAVVVILFLPEVRAYFAGIRIEEKSTRGSMFPAVGAGGGQGRPRGVSPLGLLMGRRPVRPTGSGSASSAAGESAAPPTSPSPNNPSANGGQANGRPSKRRPRQSSPPDSTVPGLPPAAAEAGPPGPSPAADELRPVVPPELAAAEAVPPAPRRPRRVAKSREQ
jgi:hypothetical protein